MFDLINSVGKIICHRADVSSAIRLSEQIEEPLRNLISRTATIDRN